MLKKSFFLPLMAASIGGPFLFFAGESESDPDIESEEQVIDDVELAGFESSSKKIYKPAGELGGIFNFKLTPQAVESRWPEATKSSINGLQIYRTSMLSGHGPQDPAGALTYQFKGSGRLKTIQFSGFVTDPSHLASFVTSKFGFARTDESGTEFRPTSFSGHAGQLRFTKSREYRDQFKVALTVSR